MMGVLLAVITFFSGFSVICPMEHTVAWNSQNPFFKVDLNEEIDAPVLRVKHSDSFKFECPIGEEYLVINRVNEMSFLNCMLEHMHTVVIVCDTPSTPKHLKQRVFSATPGRDRYEPGQSYYFITTSHGTKSGMNRTSNGLCSRENMRLRMDVEPVSSTTETSTEYYYSHPRRIQTTTQPPPPELTPLDTEQRKDNVISGLSSALPSSIDQERLRQVIEWASRGMEGTFRYTLNNDNKAPESTSVDAEEISVDNINVLSSSSNNENSEFNNLLDEGKYFITEEETARYSASSSSLIVIWSALLTTLFVFLSY